MALSWRWQEDFAAGVLRSAARDQEVGVGVSNAVNGLFDDDGDCYLRGRTIQHSELVAGAPLTFLWTGALSEGPIGFASSAEHTYVLRPDSTLEEHVLGGPLIGRPVKPAVLKDVLYIPPNLKWTGISGGVIPPESAGFPAPLPGMVGTVHLAAAGNRLVIAQGRFVRFSASGDATTWGTDDYHELPEGTIIRGLATIKDTVLVFTGYGVWSIQNLALDLTDDLGNPQQVLQKLLPEVALLHEAGLAEWGGRIVVPCNDRVLLIDTISAPTAISDSIAPLYMQHVRAGRLPGGAKVFNNHYFLPWLNTDGTVASVMVCRLNRPVRGRQVYYPWSILTGHAAGFTMADISAVTDVPTMLAAHHDGRVVDLGGLFNPGLPADADGTIPEFDLETRHFPTGNGQPNHFRALRLEYTLEQAEGSPAPTINAALSAGNVAQTYELLQLQFPDTGYAGVFDTYADYAGVLHGGLDETVWGPSEWADDPTLFWAPLAHQPLQLPGLDPAQWMLDHPQRVRYVRVRFRCTDPVARLIVHRIGFGVRPATHQR
jgi:hypothetical protein